MCTVLFTDSNVWEVFSGIEEPYLEYILESLVFCICLIRMLTAFGDITVCLEKRMSLELYSGKFMFCFKILCQDDPYIFQLSVPFG